MSVNRLVDSLSNLNIKSDIDTLLKILTTSEIKNDTFFNFQSIVHKKKYNIPESKLNYFWSLYDQYSWTNDLFLLEYPFGNKSLLRFDIDIKPPTKNSINKNKHLYDEEFILVLVREINKIIKEIKKPIDDATACVFTKEGYIEKDGIHIIYPYLNVEHNHQKEIFIDKLNHFFIKKYKDLEIVADHICTKPWVLHNSRKNKESLKYKLTHVYTEDLKLQDKLLFNKPSIYSINKYLNHSEIRSNIQLKHEISDEDEVNIEENYQTIVKYNLIDRLSIDRSYDWNSWISIGLTLKNICFGHDPDNLFYELFRQFSAKSKEKYNEILCRKQWDSFKVKNDGVGLKYLYNCAKKDNPSLFNKDYIMCNGRLVNEHISDITECLSDEEKKAFFKSKKNYINDSVVAGIMASIYPYEIAFTKNKKEETWYVYEKTNDDDTIGWKALPNAMEIENRFSDRVPQHLAGLFNAIIDDSDTDEEKLFFIHQQNLWQKALGELKKRDSIIKWSRNLWDKQHKGFAKKLNKSTDTIRCNNGILDLTLGIFRPITPDDYITLSTHIDYKKPSDEIINNIYDYLNKLFVDPLERDNYLEIIASCLIGGSADKRVIIAMGDGDCGKSQIVNFIMEALGDYASVMPRQILYERKTGAGDAQPHLVSGQYSRIAFVHEVKSKETLATDDIKSLAGNDANYQRTLYDIGSKGKNMFTIYTSCNNFPQIPQSDPTAWNRFIFIKFRSKFVDKLEKKDIGKSIFPCIVNLDSFFKKHASGLLYILFEKYLNNKRKYCDEHGNDGRVTICDSFLNYKDEIRQAQNPIRIFATDKLKISTSDEDWIGVTPLFQDYKEWQKITYPSERLPNRPDFIKIINELFHISVIKRNKSDGWTKLTYTT